MLGEGEPSYPPEKSKFGNSLGLRAVTSQDTKLEMSEQEAQGFESKGLVGMLVSCSTYHLSCSYLAVLTALSIGTYRTLGQPAGGGIAAWISALLHKHTSTEIRQRHERACRKKKNVLEDNISASRSFLPELSESHWTCLREGLYDDFL